MLSRLLCAALLVLTAAGLPALEIQRGKLKLSVNEKNGRFVLYGSEDQVKPVWTPLFLADDPTTSKWKLQIADKVYVLGDDQGFATSVESTATGARITWTSKILVATLSLDFILSANSAVADGLKLDMTLVNVSSASVKAGIRWVLDTNLGEKKEHFRLSSGDPVSNETKLEGSYPDFWDSPSAVDDAFGLIVMLGKGSTPPSRVIFANWKRLDESSWDSGFKQGREFNLLPYSFNDSAVAEYWDPQDIAPGLSREVVVAMGLQSGQSFADFRVASANPIDDLLKKNRNPALSAIDQDIASLNTLAAQIDAKLADAANVSPEDLKLLQAVLDQIEARKNALTVKP
jgi:hypothetical protein